MAKVNEEIEAEDGPKPEMTERRKKEMAKSKAIYEEEVKKYEKAIREFYEENKNDVDVIKPDDPYWWQFREKDPLTDMEKLRELQYNYNNRSWNAWIKTQQVKIDKTNEDGNYS